MKTQCELCGAELLLPSDPCFVCPRMSKLELIEQAHETISGWKRIVIAAAIANGGQTVLSPEHLLEAQTRKFSITTDPWKDVRITIDG